MFLQVGDVVDDKFKIVRGLGAGGMGLLFEAEQLGLDRNVAIKFIAVNAELEPESYPRFERESIALSRLRHRSIVTFLGFGQHQGSCYIAMELLSGQTLQQKLDAAAGNRLPVSDIMGIFKQICNALEYAHNQGLVHRDLKPANVMLLDEPDGVVVKLIDFGLVRFTRDFDRDLGKLTATGTAIGSVWYMSPEQCFAAEVDHRSDIYSVGCILFQCLTAVPPFQHVDPAGVCMAHLKRLSARLSDVRPDLDRIEDWQKVLDVAMAKNPDDRFENAGKMRSALESLECGSPLDLKSPKRPLQQKRRVSGSVLMLLSVAVLLLGGIIAAEFVSRFRSGEFAGPGEGRNQIQNSSFLLSRGLFMAKKKSDHVAALALFEKSLELAKVHNDVDGVLKASVALAHEYVALEQYGACEDILHGVIDSPRLKQLPDEYVTALSSLGTAYVQTDKNIAAEKCFRTKLQFVTATGVNGICELRGTMLSEAVLLVRLNRYREACDWHRRVVRTGVPDPDQAQACLHDFQYALPRSAASPRQQLEWETDFFEQLFESLLPALIHHSNNQTEQEWKENLGFGEVHSLQVYLDVWPANEKEKWLRLIKTNLFRLANAWAKEGDKKRSASLFDQCLTAHRTLGEKEDAESLQCRRVLNKPVSISN